MEPLLIVLLAIGLFHRDALCYPTKDESDVKIVVLQNEEMEPTILECDYEVERDPSFITVKWYRDEKNIYQWIFGKPPNAIPEFRDEIDISYEGSTDPSKQYSSLALINPTINTTGDYKCLVQTELKTFTSHQRVQVIDVRNYTLELLHKPIHNETQLECIVTNVYPRPIITILSNDQDVVKREPNVKENEDGYFNGTAVVAVYDIDDDPDAYQCIVSFDGYANNLTTVATSASAGISHAGLNLWLFCFLYYLLSKLGILI
ncbi:uncharacterized protein LOC108090958 [Drosophila ficusphila]|uniref:uncharacterized protein LOC108090958 n=1 Tax=Drosophila ficusphila TaxID=30025 RepID=UPI0007E693D2|nr:uncharacterized protein LOC108090958 [Drosophila ficusphila]